MTIEWAFALARNLTVADFPVTIAIDTVGVQVSVPFRGVVYTRTTQHLAEIAARHDGQIVVDFAAQAIVFTAPTEEAPTDG